MLRMLRSLLALVSGAAPAAWGSDASSCAAPGLVMVQRSATRITYAIRTNTSKAMSSRPSSDRPLKASAQGILPRKLLPDIPNNMDSDKHHLQARRNGAPSMHHVLLHDETLLRQKKGETAVPLEYPFRFRPIAFAEHLYLIANDEHYERAKAAAQPSWTWGFLATLLAMVGFTRIFSTAMDTDTKAEQLPDDEVLVPSRGRSCWASCCVLLFFFFCYFVFGVTVLAVGALNAEIREDPQYVEIMNGKEVLVTRKEIEHPGMRAYETGFGVAMSGLLGILVIFGRRYEGSVRITTSLLVQFFLRASSMSLVIAIALEILGQTLLGKSGFPASTLRTFVMMGIVGASEELAKLLAVTACLWFSASELKNSPASCCKYFCYMLVESPRALMLAGLSAGFGFMTLENATYMLSSATTPPIAYNDVNTGEGSNGMLVLTIIVRVFLNIHPWLTGLSAGRIARLIYGQDKSTSLSASDILWAIAPSAAIHGLYDFVVTVAPGIIGLFAPPAFWYYSRWRFIDEWESETAITGAALVDVESKKSTKDVGEEDEGESDWCSCKTCCCCACVTLVVFFIILMLIPAPEEPAP